MTRNTLGLLILLLLGFVQQDAQSEIPAGELPLLAPAEPSRQAPSAEAAGEAVPVPDVAELFTSAREDTILALEQKPLRPFGLNLFNRIPTAVDTTIGAVDESYPVGPGDEIVISIWGDLEEAYRLRVNREGIITIPRLGVKAHFQLKQSQARVNVSARHRELFNTELGLYGLPEHRQMTVTFDPTQTWFDVEQCRGYPTVAL